MAIGFFLFRWFESFTLSANKKTALWRRGEWRFVCIFADGGNEGIAAIQLAASNSPPDYCIEWFESPTCQNRKPPVGWLPVLAESVRFELTVGFPITSFQDWLLKPLGQLST